MNDQMHHQFFLLLLLFYVQQNGSAVSHLLLLFLLKRFRFLRLLDTFKLEMMRYGSTCLIPLSFGRLQWKTVSWFYVCFPLMEEINLFTMKSSLSSRPYVRESQRFTHIGKKYS